MKTKKITLFGIFEVEDMFGHTLCKEYLEFEITFSKYDLYPQSYHISYHVYII